MNIHLGHGAAAPPSSASTSPSLPPQDVRIPAPPAGGLPARSASVTGVAAPARSPVARDTPAPPAALPMEGRLAQAFAVSQAALAQVTAIFEGVGRGEPVAISVAKDTVGTLLACLDQDADALLSLIRMKAHGDYACMHSVAVSALMACLARHMGCDDGQRREAALAGLLHDIGKAFVPARVLAKPGRLTDTEYAVVRSHPRHGFDALQAAGGTSDAVKDVAWHHHERPDGRGYPDGLPGHRIALLARMGAVCDVYDAITSNRPYKDGWDPAAAMEAMGRWAEGGQFDARVMAAFRTLMGPCPIGSLVRLRSARLAVVNARPSAHAVGATVTVFWCLQSQRPLPAEVLEVGTPRSADAIVGPESNATWRFRDLDALWAGGFAQRVRGVRPSGLFRAPG